MPSLARSRAKRNELLKLFNYELPESIMRADKTNRGKEDMEARHSYNDLKSYQNKGLGRSGFGRSSVGGRTSGALSSFPQNIGRAVLLLYSEPRQIVVDPFMGHDSRMGLYVENGRHYIGFDISKRFMRMNDRRRKELELKYPNVKIALRCQDSRHLFMKDCYADFTLTSPPYWNLEFYGNEPEQLGKAKAYEEFLADLAQVAPENYRVLKHGACAVWFVNDFRAKGRFYSYHVDTLKLLTDAGFVQHDIMIVDLGPSFGSIFVQTTIGQRRLPKRHEYGLVMRKL